MRGKGGGRVWCHQWAVGGANEFTAEDAEGAEGKTAMPITNREKCFDDWKGGSRRPGAIFKSVNSDRDIAIHPGDIETVR